jgi:hypothetical protein
MHASTPENPFGVRDPRPEDEQFKGHLLATAAFAVTALACAVVGYKTGTEIIGYPAAAVSESIAVVNGRKVFQIIKCFTYGRLADCHQEQEK